MLWTLKILYGLDRCFYKIVTCVFIINSQHVFCEMLAQIIRLKAQFSNYTIKTIRLDNAWEFTSQAFNDYCISTSITVEHPVAHVHTQNGLAESLIKRLKLIARSLLIRTKLSVSMWGHVILHAVALVRIRQQIIINSLHYN